MERLSNNYHSLPISRSSKGNGNTLHAYFKFEGRQYRIVLDRRSVQPLMALKVQLKTIGKVFVIC